MIVEDLAELGGEALAMEQVRNAQRAPRHFVLVGGADAAPGRADGIRALGLLARPIERHVRGENQRTGRAHAQPLEHRHALIDQHLRLFEQRLERQHHAVADQALHVRVQDAGRNEREHGFLAADDQRVPGVVAALEARHGLRLIGEQIDDLALALVAPLQADHDQILTHCAPSTSSASPTTMLISPPQRSCAGSVCDSFAMSRFAAPGLMKRQHALEHQVQREGAARDSAPIRPNRCPSPMQRCSAAAAVAGLLKYLKYALSGANHQQIALRAHRLAIGLHAAVEAVELRVLRIRLRVHLARRGIALAAGLARLPRRIGEDLGLLLVRLGADAVRSLHALGAQLRRLRLEGRAHALEHRILHLLRQIDLGDAHVDQLDARAARPRSRAVFIMASVNSVRSAVTTCCSVRCVTTLLMLSLDGLAQAGVGDILAAAGRSRSSGADCRCAISRRSRW